MRGILALDIDGTLTADTASIPEEVVCYLGTLVSSGWRLCVITGRSFGFARPLLHGFSFPYFLAVHNGAIILEMPAASILKKEYLTSGLMAELETICGAEATDFIIYTGMENEDLCYYRPSRFNLKLLGLIERRAVLFQERWRPVDTFADLPVSGFPAVKCFGEEESVHRIARDFTARLGLHVPVIRDPYGHDLFLALATNRSVSKGGVVVYLKAFLGGVGPVIAAGDDYNDLPMLEVADIKIVMGSAPAELRAHADLVAPPADQRGIITALEQVVGR